MMTTFLADIQLPEYVDAHLRWFIAGGLILIAMVVSGFNDLSKLSLYRIRAIASVCFQESIRKRVLWIIPLAIVGVIVVLQLLKPYDAPDAIRQTLKYILFTTGAMVVMVTIILACTNLPKEIENRVIFTIVTKPTTRLEIILGKIGGFATVSGTLILIMGLFAIIYLYAQASSLQSGIRTALETLPNSDPSRESLEHHASHGLLQAKALARPVDFQTYATVPKPTDSIRWMAGGGDGTALIAFDLPAELFPTANSNEENGGLKLIGKIADNRSGLDSWVPSPFIGGWPEAAEFKGISLSNDRPLINIQILNANKNIVIATSEFKDNGEVKLSLSRNNPEQEIINISSKSLDRFTNAEAIGRRIYVRISASNGMQYGFFKNGIRLFSPRLKAKGGTGFIEPLPHPDGSGWPIIHGRELLSVEQLRCGMDLSKMPTSVIRFRNLKIGSTDGEFPMEIRVPIEGSGDDLSSEESPTKMVIDPVNFKTGEIGKRIEIKIESNRTAFFSIPRSIIADNGFDLHLRCQGTGHYLVLRGQNGGSSILAVTDHQPFLLNLCKSLFVLWLFSLLVITASVFCSTFVSWPIAVILTVVILLGHWGASQISDSNAPGMGAAVAKDLFGAQKPSENKVISTAVDNLSRLLNIVARVLPDISEFSATDDIERGVIISTRVLTGSIKVLLAFALPMAILAYAILKRKEVAP